MEEKIETYYLSWKDPRDDSLRNAGVAFYNEKFGEFVLKIDEDCGVQYFLRPTNANEERQCFRMEICLKKSDGKFLKRQSVGEGYKDATTEGNIHISYGSKYATLILFGRL